MNILLFFLLAPFLLAFFVLLFFYFLIGLDSIIFRHDLPTSKKARKMIFKIISERGKKAGNFYDLGCAKGGLVIDIKSEFPSLSVWGIDKNPIRIFLAKLRAWIKGKEINFRHQDLFKTDLSQADIVYTYLWYDLMPPLEEKLRRELKKGAIVITNTSHFSHWEPNRVYITHPKRPDFEKLFLYEKKEEGWEVSSKQIGVIGEQKAADFLKGKGYQILDRNYPFRIPGSPQKGEIDIIAKKDGVISFVEVKTLRKERDTVFLPERKVNSLKQRRLKKAAFSWMMKKKIPLNSKCEIDVVGIILSQNLEKAEIRHFKNITA